ncbi:GH116 family glycosyl hydrolase [Mucilaginibacter sp. AW1-3]
MKAIFLIIGVFFISMAFGQLDSSHHVPLAKTRNPDKVWANGPTTYRGEQLETIGMPIGGIAAGQLYLRGDGTLACWWIANNAYNTGDGHHPYLKYRTRQGTYETGYQTFRPASYVENGFTLKVKGQQPVLLNKTGCPHITFAGEYPVATVQYHNAGPVKVTLTAWSPFIPLDARESATPASILQYTLYNGTNVPEAVSLSGQLQNPVELDEQGQYAAISRNRVLLEKGRIGVMMDVTGNDIPQDHAFNGNVTLSLLGHGYALAEQGTASQTAEKPLGIPLIGEVGQTLILKPFESQTLTFILSWYFPNRPQNQGHGYNWNEAIPCTGTKIGNNYVNWFKSSKDVAAWVSNNFKRLQDQTMAFHHDWYSGTIPYWLNRRILMPVSTLATETCQWWGNGKFYGWEGVGSCEGTCTHVWNYEQALAHLFPELERNLRERTDLATSLRPDGKVDCRNGHGGYVMDGQAGTILKAYREHLASPDNAFLDRNWAKIKSAMQVLILADGNGDGLIEGDQPNTYDIAFHGANTYVGSLYLAALKAAARMARTEHDQSFADSCGQIAAAGSLNSSERLFNGHYFVQDVDLAAYPKWQYGRGCLSDQLFGQTWAGLTGLGYLYPKAEIDSALLSIYRYNWAPDIAAQTSLHPAERDFANAGEAGLLVCTWPFSAHPGNTGVRYRDEVWTGVEYQVATNLIQEGYTNEALAILKGLDRRYDGTRHNPWNEIECGDHDARAMASYGVLLVLEGLQYDGPNQSLSFTPKVQKDRFKGFLSTAEGWGTISQEKQSQSISISYGKLPLRTLSLEQKKGRIQVLLNGKAIQFTQNARLGQIELTFTHLVIRQGQTLTINYV